MWGYNAAPCCDCRGSSTTEHVRRRAEMLQSSLPEQIGRGSAVESFGRSAKSDRSGQAVAILRTAKRPSSPSIRWTVRSKNGCRPEPVSKRTDDHLAEWPAPGFPCVTLGAPPFCVQRLRPTEANSAGTGGTGSSEAEATGSESAGCQLGPDILTIPPLVCTRFCLDCEVSQS